VDYANKTDAFDFLPAKNIPRNYLIIILVDDNMTTAASPTLW
jgi:hypothetical protein